MLVTLFLAIFYNLFLSPRKVDRTTRLTVGLVWGICIGWLCFARFVWTLSCNFTLDCVRQLNIYSSRERVNPLSRNAPQWALLIFFTCLTPDNLLVNGEALQLNGLMIILGTTLGQCALMTIFCNNHSCLLFSEIIQLIILPMLCYLIIHTVSPGVVHR
jgi:hypothetical protein